VVRGFVEEQHFRLSGEHDTERKPAAFPARERAHVALQIARREAELHCDHLDAPFELIRPRVLIAIHRRGQAIQRGCVAAGRRFLRVRELVPNLEQVAETGEQVVHHAALDSRLVSLAVVAERRALLERDHAFIGVDLARDHAQERALAGSIGRHEPRALPGLQPKRDALK